MRSLKAGMHILKKKECIKKKLMKFWQTCFPSSRNLILDGSLFCLDNKLLQEIMMLPEIFQ